MNDSEALAKAIRLSAWEAAQAATHIGLAIFNATRSQPGVDATQFTQSVLYYLRQAEQTSDSDIVINAVGLMAEAITNAEAESNEDA